MAFSSGFARGFTIGQTIKDQREKKKRKEEIERLMNETPEKVAQVETVNGGMTKLNPDDTPVTKDAYKFMGKTYDQPLDDNKVSAIRNQAIADLVKKDDPIKGLQLSQSFKQAARQDKREAKQDKYDADKEDAYKGTRYAKSMMGFKSKMKDYESQLAKYEADKAAGKQVGTPPAQPVKPEYSIADSLVDQARMLDVDARYGKLNPETLMNFAKTRKTVEDEGYTSALKSLQGGADLQAISEQFAQSGKTTFDPASVISDEMVKTDGGPATRVVKYKDNDGSIKTINALSELEGLDEADKLYARFNQQQTNKRADRADARSAARLGIDIAKESERKADKKANREARLALYAKNNGIDVKDIDKDTRKAVEAGLIDSTSGEVLTEGDKMYRDLIKETTKKDFQVSPQKSMEDAALTMYGMGYTQNDQNKWVRPSTPPKDKKWPKPSTAHIEALRKQPLLRSEFENKFGPNSASQYLN